MEKYKYPIILLLSIIVSSLCGYLYGYDRGWNMYEKLQDETLNNLFQDGIDNRINFTISGIDFQFIPRKDGKINIKERK